MKTRIRDGKVAMVAVRAEGNEIMMGDHLEGDDHWTCTFSDVDGKRPSVVLPFTMGSGYGCVAPDAEMVLKLVEEDYEARRKSKNPFAFAKALDFGSALESMQDGDMQKLRSAFTAVERTFQALEDLAKAPESVPETPAL